jgi:hypothetical protein
MKMQPMTFYLPDTRGVELSRFGKGNRKIGMNVFTYSRLAGKDQTCPGATEECEAICYAKRITGAVMRNLYVENTIAGQVPEIPVEAKLLRLHVSGDFDDVQYIESWIERLQARPDVTCWAYTRSWRVPTLLPALERLRALPNVQLFASMDASCAELPPIGWRRAWIHRTEHSARWAEWGPDERLLVGDRLAVNVADGTSVYVCPEETGHKQDCESCRYCFDGQRNDVVFLEH